MPNRLAEEKSPYLLQHAEQPVDWLPWGREALEKARRENKPIFLSIGYATCHWCHVMAHESFEDQEVAQLLNAHFVPVKVDREERPDIDGVYMAACQALTGGGGWPLSVFLTPEGHPFFAGTYFPKTSRMGMPGFLDVLKEIIRLWNTDREKILDAGRKIAEALQKSGRPSEDAALSKDQMDTAFEQLRAAFDERWGGFGPPPKFPNPHNLFFLLRYFHRTGNALAPRMVERTLDEMRRGGIFDQIGYGFHRYSVDERWLVPHFEKMLYDQALLAMAYLEAAQATGERRFQRVAEEIFEYVLRDMKDPEGGFYSAEDADTEGREGLFYTWTPREVAEVLDPLSADLVCCVYGVTEKGNFEGGRTIFHQARSLKDCAAMAGVPQDEAGEVLEKARRILFEKRLERPRPLKDDKILTAWNGLMIAALAMGARVTGELRYLNAAEEAAAFVWNRLRSENGRLFRRFRLGHTAHLGCLDDYAFLGWGLLELHRSTQEPDVLEKAQRLHREMIELFWDEEHGGFFFTGRDAERLVFREKDLYDGATPSGNSAALHNLLRLFHLAGNPLWEEKAGALFRCFAGTVSQYPRAYTHFLSALDWRLGPVRRIVVAGRPEDPRFEEMKDTLDTCYLPRSVVLCVRDSEKETCRGKNFPGDFPQCVEGQATAYVCEGRRCLEPVTDPEKLRKILCREPKGG